MGEKSDSFQEAYREVMKLSDEEFAKIARAMLRELGKSETRRKKSAD